MQRLTLSYQPEDERHGEITAHVENGAFSGRSSAWFSMEHLRAFGETLDTFPIVPGKELTLAGGFWSDDDKLDHTHISIRIEPAGLRGELRLWVALATPVWPQSKPDHNGVQVAIMLSYSDLDAFRRAFAALLDGSLREACLEAAPT
ncbi:hypothetical protein [Sphingomonas sp. PP-F2F-A104-K0414]|uniref:hypothetical protein n=1 Tax=Sphingomonas sp. PP-F2F-A104-K0414 TaxID=2135661 RepID=UPI00104BFA4E|nr:hypothetical protein [Sphingomonas sp. PP-F2F-A104-K0414]